MSAFCEAIRRAAAQIDTFVTAGIRVRAFRAAHYAIADGNPKHGFIDISIRLREGRSQNVKDAVCTAIFEARARLSGPAMVRRPVALSAEMRDIDAALSPKASTIRDHL